MGLIINIRGPSGSGKTELVRRVMAACSRGFAEEIERILRPGRAMPLAYRLCPPLLPQPLIVLGDYERRSGGCDTVSLTDGGAQTIFALVETWASRSHVVLLEGVALSVEQERFLDVARRHDLRVVRLTTPLEQCARNLARRRRQCQDTWPTLMPALLAQHRAVVQACRALQREARVTNASFDLALLCVCNWLLRGYPPEPARGRSSRADPQRLSCSAA